MGRPGCTRENASSCSFTLVSNRALRSCWPCVEHGGARSTPGGPLLQKILTGQPGGGGTAAGRPGRGANKRRLNRRSPGRGVRPRVVVRREYPAERYLDMSSEPNEALEVLR